MTSCRDCRISLFWCKQCLTSAVSQYWIFLVVNICFRWHLLLQCSQSCILHIEVTKLVHLCLVQMQLISWILCGRLQSFIRHSLSEQISTSLITNVLTYADVTMWRMLEVIFDLHFNAIIAKSASVHFLERGPMRYML